MQMPQNTQIRVLAFPVEEGGEVRKGTEPRLTVGWDECPVTRNWPMAGAAEVAKTQDFGSKSDVLELGAQFKPKWTSALLRWTSALPKWTSRLPW